MDFNKLLEAQEVADMIGIKRNTLRTWRSKKVGPPYIKILKTIRYRKEDVSEYLRIKSMETAKCLTK